MINEQAINQIKYHKQDYEELLANEKKEAVKVRLQGIIETYDFILKKLAIDLDDIIEEIVYSIFFNEVHLDDPSETIDEIKLLLKKKFEEEI